MLQGTQTEELEMEMQKAPLMGSQEAWRPVLACPNGEMLGPGHLLLSLGLSAPFCVTGKGPVPLRVLLQL